MHSYNHITGEAQPKESYFGLLIEGTICLALATLIGTAYCSYTTKNTAKDTQITQAGIEEIVDDEGLVTGTRMRINITGYERCLYLSEQQNYDLKVGDKLELVKWENTPKERCDKLTELKK